MFFFQISADPLYTYNKIHWTYFFTLVSLIFILKTLLTFSLNVGGLITSTFNFNLVLGLGAANDKVQAEKRLC